MTTCADVDEDRRQLFYCAGCRDVVEQIIQGPAGNVYRTVYVCGAGHRNVSSYRGIMETLGRRSKYIKQ